MIGLATTLVGYGGHRSELYGDACHKTAEVVGKHTDYPMLSFVQIVDEEVYAYGTRLPAKVISAVTKMVALPSLSGLVANWKIILQELSAGLEDAIVTIQVDGEIEAAIGGNIL